MDPNENMKPFKLARLCDCKGDLSKRWFVEFNVWDESKGRVVRKRYYQINTYKTEVERRAAANLQIKEINELLKGGYYIRKNLAGSPRVEEPKVELVIHSIKKAFDLILQIEKETVRKKSYQKGESIVKIFQEFIKPKLYLHQLTRDDLVRYGDHLILTRKVGSKTRNNHIGFLRKYFNEMCSRNWISVNPADDIKRLKESEGSKNRAYSKKQQKKILEKADPQLSLSIKIMYYCFMRPNEIRMIQLKHIDLKRNQIFVRSDISKNNKEAFVTIPKPLVKELKKLNLREYDSELFLISKEGSVKDALVPGPTKLSINMMSERHREILKLLNFKDKNYTYYSWKHTGVVAAYNAGVKIKSIQFQCRHHSLEMTDKYLKSLGLSDNDEMLNLMPEL